MTEVVTLDFLAQQQTRMLDEIAQFRNDMLVMSAIVQRLDGTMQGLVNEVRATHQQIARLVQRLERLETHA
jgi:ubiquinone biosynthesis protein UbiJ